jgi:glutaredoxin
MPINLENHTVVELKQLAKNKGLKGYSKLTKSNLIALIRKGGGGGNKVTDKCKNKKCTTETICNPSSGRCVNKSGEIGKKLLIVKTPDYKKSVIIPETPPDYKKSILGKPAGYKKSVIIPETPPDYKKSILGKPTGYKKSVTILETPPDYKKSNRIEWSIYTIKNCELCKKAKILLDYYNIKYYTLEIADIDTFQYGMNNIIGVGDYKSFPVILKNNKFIGGYQELYKIILGKQPATPVISTPPKPATPKPATPVISTPKPDTPKPATPVISTPPKPATPKPATPVISTPKPDTPKPATPVISTPPKPATPKPATPVISTPKPDTPVLSIKNCLKKDTPVISTPKPDTPKPDTPSTWNIYTIKGCELCKKSKDILTSHGIKYYTQEITDIKQFQHDMKNIIGDYKYFPVILKDYKFIGGHQELVKFFSKPLGSPIHMMNPPVVDKTGFVGLPWQEIASLTYLLHKYPKECIAIPFGGKLLSPSGGRLTDYAKREDYVWSETSLQWSEFKGDFIVPSGLWISIKNCLKKGSDFILIPMGFLCKNNTAHSNFLIYDTKTKELERFEPNGDFNGLACVNPPNLEERIRNLLNSNVDPDMVKKVYAPMDFCPRWSFQALQSWEYGKKLPGDPNGFCAAWAVWYADTRLANPNKSRKEVVDMALEKFKSKPGTMTEFIRAYSAFLNKIRELWKNSNDPFSDIFASLIKEYS